MTLFWFCVFLGLMSIACLLTGITLNWFQFPDASKQTPVGPFKPPAPAKAAQPPLKKPRKPRKKKVAKKKGWRAIDEPFEPQMGKWQDEDEQ